MAQGVKFGRVERRHDRVVICGQGPSWADVDMADLLWARERGAVVVAVNGALDYVPEVDYFFTLDHSSENRARVRRSVQGVTYFQAVPEDYGHEVHLHVTYLRRLVNREVYDGRPFSERIWEQIVGGLAENAGEIHTGNSGFGALGVAYHMRPSRVALLGIDGHGTTRWDGSQNRYLEHMPALFRGAVPQLEWRGIEVVNGSPDSAVDCFPRLAPKEALSWLME